MMRGTSEEETLHAKESYKRLTGTHGSIVCAYIAENGRFSYPPFKEAIRKFRQKISFCGVGYYHRDAIVESSIK